MVRAPLAWATAFAFGLWIGPAVAGVAPSLRFSSVSPGWHFVCAVQLQASSTTPPARQSGPARCWGNDTYGQAQPPAGSFRSVSAGGFDSPDVGETACGVQAASGAGSGRIVCWGRLAAILHGSFTQVSVAQWDPLTSHSTVNPVCGLSVQGAVTCWTDTTGDVKARTKNGPYRQMSAAGQGACAITSTSRISCWTGLVTVDHHVPSGTFRQVSAWGTSACGLRTDGLGVCWGSEPNPGGKTFSVHAPSGRLTRILTGGRYVCGRLSTGVVSCTGPHPRLPSDRKLSQISVSEDLLCGIRSTGAPWCSGDNTLAETEMPGAPFSAVAVGDGPEVCGVHTSAVLTCWGAGFAGISLPHGLFTKVSLGQRGAWGCGLENNGRIACWGQTDLGDAVTGPSGHFSEMSTGGESVCGVDSTSGAIICSGPIAAPPSGSYSHVALGEGWEGDFGCAVRSSDGTLACWGDDHGHGDHPDGQTSPPSGEFTHVRAGFYAACGIEQSGLVECWGQLPGGALPGVFSAITVGGSVSDSTGGAVCGLGAHGPVCAGLSRPHALPAGSYSHLSLGPNEQLCGVLASGGIVCQNGIQTIAVTS